MPMRFAAVVLAALTLCGSATAAAPRRANLPQLARSLVKAGAPGAVVYVRTPAATRSGAAGYADLGARRTMRASDRYRIASVSKAFVSVVVLQLEAEGRLDIDDPVEKWLPGVVPNGGAISLRQLMNHTSGLFSYTDDQTFLEALFSAPGRTWLPKDLLAYAFTHPALFAPGANFSYSSTNYIVLGLVVEMVTGKPLVESLQQRIFMPLGMTSASFPSAIEVDDTFVHGYARIARGTPLVDVTPALSPTAAWAAGGVVANAADVTTFYRGLLTGRLLPAVQLREMELASPVAGVYGLGISTTVVSCGRAYGHNGDFPGWRNEAIATANGKREAVVMVNVDDSAVSWEQLNAVAVRALCHG